MEPTDITIEILKGIREEVRGVRDEVREQVGAVRQDLREQIGATNTRLDEVSDRVDRLHRRQIEDGVRLSSELVATNGALGMIVEELRQQRPPRARLDDLEHRVATLEERTGTPRRQ